MDRPRSPRGHITKREDSWLKNAMVQAKAASKSEFGQLYSRIAGRSGTGIATIALALELLTEVWRYPDRERVHPGSGVEEGEVQAQEGGSRKIRLE